MVTRSRESADHPRIRGEHAGAIGFGATAAGSSPHTRGALPSLFFCLLGSRIIPAYAGSTLKVAAGWLGSADHPRIRGEHPLPHIRAHGTVGSSPHTRGARGRQSQTRQHARIIPAYAGSTYPIRSFRPVDWDHPRIRGEHAETRFDAVPEAGSSPHTRGAHLILDFLCGSGGIIPAYAGSTCPFPKALLPWTDHPRIRGEHAGRGDLRRGRAGSSPHTRGAPAAAAAAHVAQRIIPAYAGSTRPPTRPNPGRADHPRIRGEHPQAAFADRPVGGSSPHTRGARWAPPRGSGTSRIIPAYAGSTGGSPHKGTPSPDHPRIRGEHNPRSCSTVAVSGSSPHTRGAHIAAPRCARPRGIIPAYAGSTNAQASGWGNEADHPRIRGEHQLALMKPGDLVGSSPHTRGARGRPRIYPISSRIIPAYAGSTSRKDIDLA